MIILRDDSPNALTCLFTRVYTEKWELKEKSKLRGSDAWREKEMTTWWKPVYCCSQTENIVISKTVFIFLYFIFLRKKFCLKILYLFHSSNFNSSNNISIDKDIHKLFPFKICVFRYFIFLLSKVITQKVV